MPRITIPNCVVPNCKGKDSKDIKLYRFPTNLITEWCQNLRMEKEKIQWHWRVCCRHFDESCVGRRKLKEGALPTKLLGHNEEPKMPVLTRGIPLRVTRCLVPHCRTTGPMSTMHRVPNPKRAEWLKICGIIDKHPERRLHICSKHFEPNMLGNRCVRRHAVPTLYLKPGDEQPTTPPNQYFDNMSDDDELIDDFIEEEIDSESYTTCAKYTITVGFIERTCPMLENIMAMLTATTWTSAEQTKLKSMLRRPYGKRTKRSTHPFNRIIRIRRTRSDPIGTFALVIVAGRTWCSPTQRRLLRVGRYMRQTLDFVLPSMSTLYWWCPTKQLHCGFNQSVINHLKTILSLLPAFARHCFFAFDEITLRQELEYSIWAEMVDGFQNSDLDTRVSKVKALPCIFYIVKGTFHNNKYPFCVY